MTVLGIATILAIVAIWFVRREWTQLAVGATVAFPQTAGIIVAGNGFPLFYIAIVVLCLLSAPRLLMDIAAFRPGAPARRPASGRFWADLIGVGLVAWAAVISIAGPRMFEGIGVFDPSLGVDVQADHLSQLHPSLGNLAQVGYLGMGMAFLLLSGRLFAVDRRLVGAALWTAIVLAAVRLVAEGAWPHALLQNMPGYSYQSPERLSGTFYEPSVLGLVLVVAAGYFGVRALLEPAWRDRGPALVALGFVALEFAFNRSGTALLGLAILVGGGVVVLLIRGLVRPVRRVFSWPGVIALVVFAAVLTQLPTILEFTVGAAGDKADSSSFANRTASNIRSWELFLETGGLGVGLGGNRPSSLFLLVLSCLGAAGVILLGALVVLALRAAFRAGGTAAAWALIATLVAAVVAVPDLSMPILWASLAACLAPLSMRTRPELNGAAGSGGPTRSSIVTFDEDRRARRP